MDGAFPVVEIAINFYELSAVLIIRTISFMDAAKGGEALCFAVLLFLQISFLISDNGLYFVKKFFIIERAYLSINCAKFMRE